VVGSVSIDHVTHDVLFAKTEILIKVAGAVVGHEHVQKQPVRRMFAECPVLNLG
jgi:hypothetical protein